MPFKFTKFWQDKIINWFKDNVQLIESILVAVSIYVAFFPVLWIIGWAFPWPKSPIITTIIEYELDKQSTFKPKHVMDFRDPKHNE